MRGRAWQRLPLLLAFSFLPFAVITHYRDRRKAAPVPLLVAHASCVADFAPCGGGVLSPVKAKCCNPLSMCFRRGRYFSQCRPRSSLPGSVTDPATAVSFQDDWRRIASAICAPDFGVCAAGIGSDSSIPCCHKGAFLCKLSTPFFHQCLPADDEKGNAEHHSKHSLDLGVDGRGWFLLRRLPTKYSFLRASDAVEDGIPLEPVTASDKLRHVAPLLRKRFRGNPASILRQRVVLHAFVPVLSHAEFSDLLGELESSLHSSARPYKERGKLLVSIAPGSTTADLWDAAMVLAGRSCVRELSFSE